MTLPSPRRGEVWMVNFNPGRGSEQLGIRPALIIQNDVGNQYASTTIVAAITSSIKIYPVTVLLKKGEAGLKQASMINLAQILTIDKSRLQRRLGALRPETVTRVTAAVRISLDVP
ncbi:MAG: type II toxin-antitoxin system PemK/MazF family toxin [candidate division NC10 bacterium]|nr:type II toxin-antitoxin system PemK/MazF family toxin [candidate division NC10 bacterium]